MDRPPVPSRRALLLGAAALALATGSCAREAPADGRPLVVSTVGQVHDLVTRLAGDALRTELLLASGVDPHTHQPTRTDAALLAEADLVLCVGLGLERPLERAFDARRRAGRAVLAVTDALPRELLLPADERGGDALDPHVWMDPRLWSRAAERVAEEVRRLAPDSGPDVDARLAELSTRIAEMDAYAARVLGSVPEPARVLVTAHDAFAYFGRRYGYQVEGVQGVSTDSEAGVRRVQELVDLLVERRVPAVFVETSVSERGPLSLVEGAAARGHRVALGGELFSDSLGAPGTYRGTYLGMLDHNATTIARALGGEAPEGGASGRLAGD